MFLLKSFYQAIFAEFLILIPEMLKASLAKIVFWSPWKGAFGPKWAPTGLQSNRELNRSTVGSIALMTKCPLLILRRKIQPCSNGPGICSLEEGSKDSLLQWLRADSDGRPEERKARHRRKKLPKGGVKEGLTRWLQGKESPCNAEATGDMSSIPGLGRSCAWGNSNPL